MSRRKRKANTSLIGHLIARGGALVHAIRDQSRVTRRAKSLTQSDIAQIDAMDGVEFENYLEVLFRSEGYGIERTPVSQDYGADLILRRNGQRIAVQAKRYAGSVGLAAVQEVVAALSIYHCASAMVVTNSHFTRAARALAKSNDVVLWDRERLLHHMQRMRESRNVPGDSVPVPMPAPESGPGPLPRAEQHPNGQAVLPPTPQRASNQRVGAVSASAPVTAPVTVPVTVPVQSPVPTPLQRVNGVPDLGESPAYFWLEPSSGRVIALTKTPLCIGRGMSNDLILLDEAVSRQHAKVIFERKGPILIDLDSKNGTRVNDIQIRRHALQPGDRIQIEQHTFVHHAADPAASSAG